MKTIENNPSDSTTKFFEYDVLSVSNASSEHGAIIESQTSVPDTSRINPCEHNKRRRVTLNNTSMVSVGKKTPDIRNLWGIYGCYEKQSDTEILNDRSLGVDDCELGSTKASQLWRVTGPHLEFNSHVIDKLPDLLDGNKTEVTIDIRSPSLVDSPPGGKSSFLAPNNPKRRRLSSVLEHLKIADCRLSDAITSLLVPFSDTTDNRCAISLRTSSPFETTTSSPNGDDNHIRKPPRFVYSDHLSLNRSDYAICTTSMTQWMVGRGRWLNDYFSSESAHTNHYHSLLSWLNTWKSQTNQLRTSHFESTRKDNSRSRRESCRSCGCLEDEACFLRLTTRRRRMIDPNGFYRYLPYESSLLLIGDAGCGKSSLVVAASHDSGFHVHVITPENLAEHLVLEVGRSVIVHDTASPQLILVDNIDLWSEEEGSTDNVVMEKYNIVSREYKARTDRANVSRVISSTSTTSSSSTQLGRSSSKAANSRGCTKIGIAGLQEVIRFSRIPVLLTTSTAKGLPKWLFDGDVASVTISKRLGENGVSHSKSNQWGQGWGNNKNLSWMMYPQVVIVSPHHGEYLNTLYASLRNDRGIVSGSMEDDRSPSQTKNSIRQVTVDGVIASLTSSVVTSSQNKSVQNENYRLARIEEIGGVGDLETIDINGRPLLRESNVFSSFFSVFEFPNPLLTVFDVNEHVDTSDLIISAPGNIPDSAGEEERSVHVNGDGEKFVNEIRACLIKHSYAASLISDVIPLFRLPSSSIRMLQTLYPLLTGTPPNEYSRKTRVSANLTNIEMTNLWKIRRVNNRFRVADLYNFALEFFQIFADLHLQDLTCRSKVIQPDRKIMKPSVTSKHLTDEEFLK